MVLQRHNIPYPPKNRMLVQQVNASTWAGYDSRVEAMLDLGAADVVESLLRTTARMPSQKECVVVKAQVHQLPGAQTLTVDMSP